MYVLTVMLRFPVLNTALLKNALQTSFLLLSVFWL